MFDWIDRLRWGKIPQRELELARKRADEISEYKEGVGWVLKPGVKLVSAKEECEEWMKDPEFAKLYESLKPEFEREWQRALAKDARKARRKAMVAKVRGVGAKLRGFWTAITRGVGDEVL